MTNLVNCRVYWLRELFIVPAMAVKKPDSDLFGHRFYLQNKKKSICIVNIFFNYFFILAIIFFIIYIYHKSLKAKKKAALTLSRCSSQIGLLENPFPAKIKKKKIKFKKFFFF